MSIEGDDGQNVMIRIEDYIESNSHHYEKLIKANKVKLDQA